jgi:hypothetical protein
MGDGKFFYRNAKGPGCSEALGTIPEEDILLYVRIPLQERDGDLD